MTKLSIYGKSALLLPVAGAGLCAPAFITNPPTTAKGLLTVVGVTLAAHSIPAALLYLAWRRSHATTLGLSQYTWTFLIATAYTLGLVLGIWAFVFDGELPEPGS